MNKELKVNGSSQFGAPEGKTFVIAGPCSAESESQVVQCAVELSRLGRVHALRAGIWKPRTHPDTFEGIGRVGLEWLRNAKAETGLPVAVEVANVRHVYEALKTGVDILWIGARTTTNPFSVQEIADALKGVSVSVLVKNPVNPDMDLWLGALERLGLAGVSRLGAVHRGFSSYERSAYRNPPHWSIPLELKRRHPGLPLLCDPSHICGTTEMLFDVSQRAMDLQFDGLMIESHIDPAHALSDARQQLPPSELARLLERLKYRKRGSSDVGLNTKLEELRERIDTIDDQLIDVLAQRMAVAEEIGRCKRDNNISIFQRDRWDDIVKSRVKSGLERNLTEKFVCALLEIIHQESIDCQAAVIRGHE